MLGVADLLAGSGKYKPVIVYHPSAVFEQNHHGCADAPFDSFIWRGTSFFAAGSVVPPASRGDAPFHARLRQTLKRWLIAPFRSEIYGRTRRSVPILPTAERIALVGRSVLKPLRPLVRVLLRDVLLPFVRACVRRAAISSAWAKALVQLCSRLVGGKSGNSGRPWQQRLLLALFADRWEHLKHRAALAETELGLLNRLRQWLDESLFAGLADQKHFLVEFERLLELEQPALVVLPEENLFYFHHLVVHAAQARGIPCLIVPFTIVNSLEWAEAFVGVEQYDASNGWNKTVAEAFPRWALTHRGKRLILPPGFVVACEYLDEVPDQPWVINSGTADAIAAESQFMAAYYARAGIRASKIRITGTLADDNLFEMLRQRGVARSALGERIQRRIQGKLVLIGLPPDQFGAGVRAGCEFQRYLDLIQFMVSEAAQCAGANDTIIINLHPRVRFEDVAHLETLGATIVREPIEDLVPLADLYIAVVSATIRLAVSCGIPVVNYDAYQYNYDDYKLLPAVLELRKKSEYRETLIRLFTDARYFAAVQSEQHQAVQQHGCLDGKSGLRILALIDELTAQSGMVNRLRPDSRHPVLRPPA